MKLTYSLILAAAASGYAFGAATAYTTPVGYVSLGKSTGDAIPANTDVHVSLTLDRATAYSGLISSVSGAGSNTINLQGTPALGSLTSTPHVVKITSGVDVGFYALISSNDASSLTVTLPAGLALSGVVSGDKIEVSEAWTAINFFESATIPADAELYIYGSAVAGINHSAVLLLAWDGGQWLDESTGDPINPVLYPGEAMVVRTAVTPMTSFTLTGQVPTAGLTNLLTHYGAASEYQDMEMSVCSPIDQTLTQTGLIVTARDSDELYIYDNSGTGFNQSASALYAFDAGSGSYLDESTGDPIDPSTILKSGTSLVVRRAPNINPAPVNTKWTFVPNYTLP